MQIASYTKCTLPGLAAAILAGLFAAPAWGQYSNGYVFIAPGGATCCGQTLATVNAGVGGEWIALKSKGIGVGAEAGVLALTQDVVASGSGLASANGYYHFLRGEAERFDPFATGGYSFVWKMGHANMGNVGAGMNYWFSRHLGARIEGRDQIQTTNGPTANYWGVRFGLAFH